MLRAAATRLSHPLRAVCARAVGGTAPALAGKAPGGRPAFAMTKIVASIGPKSSNPATIQALVDEGMRVMRLNFSHNNPAEATPQIAALRQARGLHGGVGSGYNLRAVMLDTQGPEIRTGLLVDDADVELVAGASITLTPDEAFEAASTADTLFVSYPSLATTLAPGSMVLLDDGLIELKVTEVRGEGVVVCEVVNSGSLGSRKGVNLPGVVVDLPAMSAKDREDIRFGIEQDVDYVAASFVRKGSDVREIRGYLERVHDEVWGSDAARPPPKIISKVENEEALLNFEHILRESDGIMVARGDLGVEIEPQLVVGAQKRIVRRCNAVGKPVVVATQMLESMISNLRPTRAEVSDVTNAVYDGADAVMLSGETAKGKYPREAIRTMNTIAMEADTSMSEFSSSAKIRGEVKMAQPPTQLEGVAVAAVKAAHNLEAPCIICITKNGNFPRLIAKHRPRQPVMAFCKHVKVGRQLILHRGIHPVMPSHEAADGGGGSQDVTEALRRAKELGFCRSGDTVVVVGPQPATSTLKQSYGMLVSTVL